MNEYYERPEALPNRETATFNTIASGLRLAAQRLWTPLPEEHPFAYGYANSAAGDSLTAILPPSTDSEATWLGVTIGYPSRRLRRAYGAVVPEHLDYASVHFVIHDPTKLGPQGLGVECHVPSGRLGADGLTDHDVSTIDYETFQTILEQGGICQKATPMQRMGRAALRFAGELMETQAALNELGAPPPWRRDYY